MTIRFKISDGAFDHAFDQTRITEQYKEPLREVMVKGYAYASVARTYSLNKQALNRNFNAVLRKHLMTTDTPADWHTVTVSLPPEHSDKLAALIQLELDERLKAGVKVADLQLSPKAIT
jgi:hypothetical protein